MYRKNFSEKLSLLREQKKIPLRELAKALGMSIGAVGMLEKGQRSPSFEVLCDIANFFSVSFDFLLGSDDHVDESKPVKKTPAHIKYLNTPILIGDVRVKPISFLTSFIERERAKENDPLRKKEWEVCHHAALALLREDLDYTFQKHYFKIEEVEEEYLRMLSSASYHGVNREVYKAILGLVKHDRARGNADFRKEMATVLAEAIKVLLTDETKKERKERFDKIMGNENEESS